MKHTLLAALLCAGLFSTTATANALTQTQADDLAFMYQEEKVARDVYIALGDTWGDKVFLNIQKSEQTHMDAVKGLLIKYGIPVPVVSDTRGEFDNPELQELYDVLIEKGETSRQDAMNVGILIEETDIADLEKRMVDAPDDVVDVFSKLLKASESHFRAFSRQLDNDDTTTTAETQENTSSRKKSSRKQTKRRGKN